MSQLKKQAIVGRKTTRRSKPIASPSSGSKSALSLRNALQLLGRCGHWMLIPIKTSLKRWPQATLVVALATTTLSAAGYGLYTLMRSLTNTLPERIEVNSPRIELQNTISTLASDTLNVARKENWSRVALTDKLLSRISQVDGVDEVTIRAGLDKKLRINLIAQAPLLVLEGKGSERILIGSKFKIIARGLGPDDYKELPHIDAPDMNLNVKTTRDKRKAHSGFFIRPSASSSVNVRWLSQQTVKIYSLFESEKIPVDVKKVVWKNGVGFSTIVAPRDAKVHATVDGLGLPVRNSAPDATEQMQPEHSSFTVVLGENQYQEKLERLQQIIQDLRLKNAHVDQIDLAFSDKAIIKMKEQISEVKRGGMQ